MTTEGELAEKWRDALAVACVDLAAMKDRDATAAIRLVPSGDDVILEVTLADGRSALRRVREPLALRSVLEALVALPPTRAPAPPPPPREESRPPPPPPSPLREPDVDRPSPSVTKASPTAELSLSLAGRAGGGARSLAPTADASLLFGHWQLGLSARWDVAQEMSAPRADDFEMESLAAGLVVARRMELGRFDLDVGFSPRLVVETQSHEIDDDDQTGTATDVRAAVFTRLSYGRGPLRPFATLDGELSPARVRRKIFLAPELPALPAWSAGLALGVAWSSP